MPETASTTNTETPRSSAADFFALILVVGVWAVICDLWCVWGSCYFDVGSACAGEATEVNAAAAASAALIRSAVAGCVVK